MKGDFVVAYKEGNTHRTDVQLCVAQGALHTVDTA